MLRIASAWRSVRPNSAIITGLGSSSVRMISITRSRLRKAIEIAFEQLEPVVDLRDPMLGAVDQHLDLEAEPFGQHLPAGPSPAACGFASSTLRLSGTRVSRSVSRNRLSISTSGIDGAAARLDHDPDRLVRFVAHVGEDRQLLVGDQAGDLLDQLALGHLIGDFGDHRGPACPAAPSRSSSARAPGSAPRPVA